MISNEIQKISSKQRPQQIKQSSNSIISNQNFLNFSQKSYASSNRSKVISKQPRINIFYEVKDQEQNQNHKFTKHQSHQNLQQDKNEIPQMHITYAQRQNQQNDGQQNPHHMQENNESQQEITHFMGQFMDHINELGYDTKNLNYSFCVSQKADSEGKKSEAQSQVLEQINFSQDFQNSQKQPNDKKIDYSNKTNQNFNGVGIMSKNKNSPYQQSYISSESRSKIQNVVNTNICAPQLSQSSQTIIVAKNINNNHHQLSCHLDERGQDYITTPSFPLQELHGQKLTSQALLNNRIKRFSSLNTDNIFLQRVKKIRNSQNFFNQAQNQFVKNSCSSQKQKQQADKSINNFSASNNNISNNTVIQETSHLETSFNDEFSNDQGSKAKKFFLQDKLNQYNWFSENVPLLEIKETPSHIYTLRSLKQKVSQLESHIGEIKNIKKQIQETQIPKSKEQFQKYLKFLSEEVAKRLQNLSNQKSSQSSKISQLQRQLSGLQIQNSQLKELNSQLQSSLRMISQQQFESMNSHRSNNKSSKHSNTQVQEIKAANIKKDSKKDQEAQQSSVIKPYQQQNQNQQLLESSQHILKIQSKEAKRILKKSIQYQNKVPQKIEQSSLSYSSFPNHSSLPYNYFSKKGLQNQKLEENFQEQLLEQNNFLNQQLQEQQKRNKQLLAIIEHQQNQLLQNQKKLKFEYQTQQKINQLNHQNQKLSQYVFDLQQKIVQFQQHITQLSQQLRMLKSCQKQKFNEKIQEQLQSRSRQFLNRLQTIKEDHQKQIQLLREALFMQIQSQRKKHLALLDLKNNNTNDNQNQVIIQIQQKKILTKARQSEKNQKNDLFIQQQSLKKQIKCLWLEIQTQKLFISQLNIEKMNLQSQLKDQKKRVKQLQIGSQHDFLAYSIKERELQNQNKILKYRLLQFIEKKQSLFSTASKTINQGYDNESFYQSLKLKTSRQLQRSQSKLQEIIINTSKEKNQSRTNNPESNQFDKIKKPDPYYFMHNSSSTRYNTQKINKILNNIKLKYNSQSFQSTRLNNLQKDNQKSFILKMQKSKSRPKSKQCNKVIEYNQNQNGKKYDSCHYNTELLSKKKLNLLNLQNYGSKYFTIGKKSTKLLNFGDVLSTIPISPSSVNLQKSIKMNQISQKLQKLRLDIKKQLKYEKI